MAKDSNEVTKMIGNWLGQHLSIKTLNDWDRVSLTQLNKWADVPSSKNFWEMLKTAYPKHQWNVKLFGCTGGIAKTSQKELLVATQKLFPNHSRHCCCCVGNMTQRWRKIICTHSFTTLQGIT